MARRSARRGAPRATIRNLPPEIVRLILDQVVLQSDAERQGLADLSAIGQQLGLNLEDIINQGPAAFMVRIPLGGQASASLTEVPAPGAHNHPHGAAPAPAAPHVHVHPNGHNAQNLFGGLFNPVPQPPPPAAQPAAQPAGMFNFNFNAPPFAPQPAAAAAEFDDMPPLEDVSDADTPRAPAQAPVAGPAPPTPAPAPAHAPWPRQAAPPAAVASPESEDDMPPLEDIDDEPASSPVAATESEDGMPELEAIDQSGDEGQDEWEDDDEDEDEDEDDEDAYSEELDSDEDELGTFPDGLPEEPLLPLLAVSRPFLHASREKLYRTVAIESIWQASLLLRSLAAPSHAARDALEISEQGPANALAFLVRTLTVVTGPDQTSTDISQHRGGAGVLIELMERCKSLETLIMRPTFLRSSTKPFFAALRGLAKLKRLDLTSGSDPNRPCVVTTARVYDLLQNHLFELADLTLAFLRPAEAGPSSEEAALWDQEYYSSQVEEEEAGTREADDYTPKDKKPKPKGLHTLKLLDPAIPSLELALILKDSHDKLKTFVLSRPTLRLSRFGLASTFLQCCLNLTELRLDTAPNWYPIQKPIHKVPVPSKPKDHVPGKPSDEYLRAVAAYPYFLDAVINSMPHLVTLRFDGPLASTALFSFMPKSLKTLEWAHSPTILPGPLARLLNKTVYRTVTTKMPDGTFMKNHVETIVAKGLQCVSIRHDDLQYKDADIRALEGACHDRGVCLHLSGGTVGAEQPFVPIPVVNAAGGIGIAGFIPVVRV
ncbi:hypothetical protein RQP46_010591 [Phenoliferia psychrophenolica]